MLRIPKHIKNIKQDVGLKKSFSSPGYVNEIRKRMKNEIKYFDRHGITTDKSIYFDSINDKALVEYWNSSKFTGMNRNDKIKKITSLIVFPSDISRSQAENLVKASEAMGKKLSFAEVLQGKFDSLQLTLIRQEKYADLLKDYDSATARKLSYAYISHQFFGSD